MNNTIRPIRTFAFLEQTDSSKYIIDLEAWCDNIEQLHANQARTIADLRDFNETQMHRINEVVEQSANKDLTIVALQAEVEARQASIDIWKADLAIIREELQSEAEHRDWCSEYRDFADRVNARLAVAMLGPELRIFKVLHEYRVTLTASLLAKDLNEAHDLADRQYGGIRESVIFSLPDDSEDALDPDRGELHHVRWSHQTTDAMEAEGNDW